MVFLITIVLILENSIQKLVAYFNLSYRLSSPYHIHLQRISVKFDLSTVCLKSARDLPVRTERNRSQHLT